MDVESSNKRKQENIKKILLTTVKTAGFLSVAILAPNALRVFKQLSNDQSKQKKYYIKGVISKLLRKGLIEYDDAKKGIVKLTKIGEEELLKYELGDLKIKKPKRWDGKWRVVVFDIEEKKKKIRDMLRFSLFRLGFVRLQNSVWVFPYDCEELVLMLKSNLFVDNDVLYMKVDSIENDDFLRERFEL